ncbi:MAG: hypothetical protein ACE1ZA_01685, partial [Pseudomonadales bacterium]
MADIFVTHACADCNRWRHALLGSVWLLSLFGCIPMGPTNVVAKTQNDLGLYRGYFATALTPDPSDDLNYNPCDERVADCTRHQAPLIDILLRLSENDEGRLRATFFSGLADLQAGVPLDLLGRGCGSRVGSLEEFNAGKNDSKRWTARFALNVRNRTCLGKLRPTSSHFLVVEMIQESDSIGPSIDVLIDKRVVDKNFLYIKEKGRQRRVKIDVANTQGEGRRARYRICVENELGEFEQCVLTDKQLKSFALPIPVPGGVAVNYSWWY